MNDSGKTNMLHALRFLLDYRIRKNGFIESDYHQFNIDSPIEIILEIDISDNNKDSDFIISIAGQDRVETNTDTFYFKIFSTYNKEEQMGDIFLQWGSDLTHLVEIPAHGQRSKIDTIFKVVYLDPNIDLENYFKNNRNIILQDKNLSEFDMGKEVEIKENISKMNENIAELEMIQDLESELTETYKKYRDESINIEIKSEISINGYLNELVPYIKWKENDENYYPTGGDGRKKLLAYALNNITQKRVNNPIIRIFLIEEPENSLHRSMQIGLSKQLFSQKELYKYFFMTTHSEYVLYEMDQTQLIRISNLSHETANSYLYEVPKKYQEIKRQLNKDLSSSMFYNKILLVEGGSEYTLFEKILNVVKPDFEMNGNFLLQVDGISFKPYIELYNNLSIEWMIKTDNDLRRVPKKNEYNTLGLNRCLKILEIEEHGNLEITEINIETSKNEEVEILNQHKKDLYSECDNEGILTVLQDNNIYLSEIDLEYDFAEILKSIEIEFETNLLSEIERRIGITDLINWLQDHKLYNMIDLCKELTIEECRLIYNNSEVLKGFIGD